MIIQCKVRINSNQIGLWNGDNQSKIFIYDLCINIQNRNCNHMVSLVISEKDTCSSTDIQCTIISNNRYNLIIIPSSIKQCKNDSHLIKFFGSPHQSFLLRKPPIFDNLKVLVTDQECLFKFIIFVSKCKYSFFCNFSITRFIMTNITDCYVCYFSPLPSKEIYLTTINIIYWSRF